MHAFDMYVQKYSKLPTEKDPNYLELLRMTKYRILDIPDVTPAKCANCGSCKNDGRQYIDFGLHVDWYGAVFICGLCLNDIAKAMGLFKDLEEIIAKLQAESNSFAHLQEKGFELNEKFAEVFREFKEYHDGLLAFGNDPTPDPDPDLGNNENETGGSGTNQTESGTSKAKPKPAKSTSSSGREDVRSLADLLNISPNL